MKLRYASHLGFRSFDEPLFPHSAKSISPSDQIQFAKIQGFSAVADPWHTDRPINQRQEITRALKQNNLASGSVVCGKWKDLMTPLWFPQNPNDWDA